MHLFDGGLADNLGLRATLDGVLRRDDITQALSAIDMQQTRRVVVILVNVKPRWTLNPAVKCKHRPLPPPGAALQAAATLQFRTVALLKDKLKEVGGASPATPNVGLPAPAPVRTAMHGRNAQGSNSTLLKSTSVSIPMMPSVREIKANCPHVCIDE